MNFHLIYCYKIPVKLILKSQYVLLIEVKKGFHTAKISFVTYVDNFYFLPTKSTFEFFILRSVYQ